MLELDSVFEEHRTDLSQLAYRMLGSLSDSDDVLQEAYLRWSRQDRAEVRSPRAYLTSVVTRLCIDQRRSRLVLHHGGQRLPVGSAILQVCCVLQHPS